MRQIIVNVSGLTTEEKQRVNEAGDEINKLHAEAERLRMQLAACGVVAMANTPESANRARAMHPEYMSASCQDVMRAVDREMALRDQMNRQAELIHKMAGMTTKRKVRADFDLTKEYSVDVSGCTEDEKKTVQQAFFDAGFMWEVGGKEYRHLNEVQYSNTTGGGHVTKFCMRGATTKECNMTPAEFLELVYEPEQRGHVHAELMAQYAEDAKTTDKPWELWQLFTKIGTWVGVDKNPDWCTDIQYRRKPKTHIVHGVEVPDLRFEPKEDEEYWFPHPSFVHLCTIATCGTYKSHCHRVSNNLCYEPTMEGKQAAILHAKAMLSST